MLIANVPDLLKRFGLFLRQSAFFLFFKPTPTLQKNQIPHLFFLQTAI